MKWWSGFRKWLSPRNETFWTLHAISVRGEHLTDTDYCWCQPMLIDVPPDNRVIVHKRTLDGPRSDDA